VRQSKILFFFFLMKEKMRFLLDSLLTAIAAAAAHFAQGCERQVHQEPALRRRQRPEPPGLSHFLSFVRARDLVWLTVSAQLNKNLPKYLQEKKQALKAA
jgi:hypothetical protein